MSSGRCLGSKVEALKMSVPSSMKALVKQEAGLSYTYTDVSMVPPQGDELLVKVGKVALCGSDISLYQWNNGEDLMGFLVMMGVHVAVCLCLPSAQVSLC